MAGLCEGGNEPPGSLKATIQLSRLAKEGCNCYHFQFRYDRSFASFLVTPARHDEARDNGRDLKQKEKYVNIKH
ncbi:hypothetical protein ANN_20760 [Periplaneta americana]|uniref:Uncharacterized protein n=1 Tax=Periplaneta americana TaxID=6978 RepID=A0ABQ8SDH3_PERAM|nr:hypothetical protein ANN_20760 [Periplaneta americana]